MAFRIHLQKESFKFSGTHFTIFSADQGERMHGHNYYVGVTLEVESLDPKLGLAFDFNLVKPVVKALCNELDEYILIPTLSPFLKVTTEMDQVSVSFNNKTYSFPKADVRELPLVNVTSEELARYLAICLRQKLGELKILALTVEVEETRGQSVSYTLS